MFEKILPVIFLAIMGLALVTAVIISGCSRTAEVPAADDSRIHIVTTTTMLADLAENIGKDRVSVQGLMGPGVDPHLYQASAGDVGKMQQADVIIYNGLHLEGKMGDVLESLRSQGKTVICIEDGIENDQLLGTEEDENIFDPHIWFDVSIWKSAAAYTASELGKADPDHAGSYLENKEQYITELNELDQYIRSRIEELPEDQRVLITAHDAFRYFGRRYGFEVMGLQGLSTDAEAGTADVRNLAQFIVDHQIKAIFVESSVPPKTIESLQDAVRAKGFEAEIGGELYSDSLGGAEAGADTYIATFRANIDTITDALK